MEQISKRVTNNMSSKQRSRVLLRRLAGPAVAVCTTLLALLAGETIVRVLGRAPGIKPIQLDSYDCIYKRSTNPILGFELKANCRSDNPDLIQTYERTNSHGQRDSERTLEKPDGVRRILLLGDSVVEGYGLRESETISRQLEDLYGGRSTEVLNFGVSAYCTLAEVELLEVKGLRFDPDVVIIVFVENDFDNFNREAFPLGGSIDRPAVVEALFKKSHLFRLASVQLNLFHLGAEADPVRWNKDAIGDNNVAEGFQRLRQLADSHGFQPLVAIWPRFLDDRIANVCFMPQNNKQLVVEHLAAMHGIPSVRLSEFFQRHRAESAGTVNPRLHYSCGDELHPSPEGARVAAGALKLIIDDLDAGRVPWAREISRSAQSDAEAIAAAKALGRAKPNYARVHNRMGTELLKEGKLKEAAAEFKQAIEADPTHAGAHNNLGIAYERMGRQEAQAQFERAIQLRSDFTHAHFNLARILIKTGRINEAVAELRRTIQIDPDHVGALNMLGMAHGRQQKFAEAQAHLERAVRLDPNHAEARSNLGAAYAGQGRLREAIAQFEAALRIDPDNPEARENLRRVKAALQE
ncbi:MAG: tetratricopeptide repeat protein [Phycisphaerales bacterium]|nr:MAG: tetratricopeptide repeat protein [Phycisphaerales bacterium]